MQYKSITGGGAKVNFETAILDGFAADGGLYMPEHIPQISTENLKKWSFLSFQELAYEILSLYIPNTIISEAELKNLITNSYQNFDKENVVALHKLKSRKETYILEMFYGPTLSFKDVGQSFLIHLLDFFLERKKEKRTLILATTGDTGPAAAHFSAGKTTFETWVLYPKDRITPEQERQMTTIPFNNIHPVSVSNCVDGGDDLDKIIETYYQDQEFKESLKLSSVNSINWGRILIQTVHYFYSYFQVADFIGDPVHIAVPSGGFGNLGAGTIAREMGLPIDTYISCSNVNNSLDRIFSLGQMSKATMQDTLSSAIDILIPYNFWRYLYLKTNMDSAKIQQWKEDFETHNMAQLDAETLEKVRNGFLSATVKDSETLKIMQDIYLEEGYILDPHGAVALAACDKLSSQLNKGKLICIATAHPAKFPDIIAEALQTKELPLAATHTSIEKQKQLCAKSYSCSLEDLETSLKHSMLTNFKFRNP